MPGKPAPLENYLYLVGRKFGKWTVIGRPHRRGKHNAIYIDCRCDCGTLRPVITWRLIRGKTTSCLCQRSQPTSERFLSQVQKTDGGCWLWQGQLNEDGYGTFVAKRRSGGAHVWAYRLFVGEVPDGLEIDHTCRNRACVNPEHLDPVTHHENVLRGWERGINPQARDYCVNGHPRIPENTRIKKHNGQRQCTLCEKLYMRRARETRKCPYGGTVYEGASRREICPTCGARNLLKLEKRAGGRTKLFYPYHARLRNGKPFSLD